jgi:hypothetical protein
VLNINDKSQICGVIIEPDFRSERVERHIDLCTAITVRGLQSPSRTDTSLNMITGLMTEMFILSREDQGNK